MAEGQSFVSSPPPPLFVLRFVLGVVGVDEGRRAALEIRHPRSAALEILPSAIHTGAAELCQDFPALCPHPDLLLSLSSLHTILHYSLTEIPLSFLNVLIF